VTILGTGSKVSDCAKKYRRRSVIKPEIEELLGEEITKVELDFLEVLPCDDSSKNILFIIFDWLKVHSLQLALLNDHYLFHKKKDNKSIGIYNNQLSFVPKNHKQLLVVFDDTHKTQKNSGGDDSQCLNGLIELLDQKKINYRMIESYNDVALNDSFTVKKIIEISN